MKERYWTTLIVLCFLFLTACETRENLLKKTEKTEDMEKIISLCTNDHTISIIGKCGRSTFCSLDECFETILEHNSVNTKRLSWLCEGISNHMTNMIDDFKAKGQTFQNETKYREKWSTEGCINRHLTS